MIPEKEKVDASDLSTLFADIVNEVKDLVGGRRFFSRAARSIFRFIGALGIGSVFLMLLIFAAAIIGSTRKMSPDFIVWTIFILTLLAALVPFFLLYQAGSRVTRPKKKKLKPITSSKERA
jgi:hydrogenase-4 membrane subunit HyfE